MITKPDLESKGSNLVLLKMKYCVSAVIFLFFFCGFFVLSCNEVERHNVLTFFFDGVPPLGQEGLEEEFTGSGLLQIEQAPPKSLWYVHEPVKNCTLCHDKSRQKIISIETYLHTPVPKLCYNCHSDYTVSSPYVHGPVVVGQCLYCHTHHKSKVKHLLKEPEPELCYKCHDQYAIELIPGHFTMQMSMCTNCHNSHASSTKALLKVPPDRMREMFKGTRSTDSTLQNYNSIPDEEAEKKGLEPTVKNEAEKRSLLQVFTDVKTLIEQGHIQKARLYLIGFKDSSAFTDQERIKITEVLNLIEDTLSKNQQVRKEGQQNLSEGERYTESPASKSQEKENQQSEQSKLIADLYNRSMQLYRAGYLLQAREGFTNVINSGLIPPAMAETIHGYLSDIENKLSGGSTLRNSER